MHNCINCLGWLIVIGISSQDMSVIKLCVRWLDSFAYNILTFLIGVNIYAHVKLPLLLSLIF